MKNFDYMIQKMSATLSQSGVLGTVPNASEVSWNLREAKEEFEQRLIQLVLHETHGNKSRAARMLGITREGLRKALIRGGAVTPTTTTGTDDGFKQAA
ncbi:MAG: hypothetical protein JST16_05555 [Bdellovibrionales bacterium]|nr:hypothetical protein [Bdellovibrionales bacterium]